MPDSKTASTSSPLRGASHRSVTLDFLRGVAILLVLGRHWVVDPSQAGWFRPLAVALDRFGWTGVDLFFVLSGFLIGGLLLSEIRKEGRLNVGRFLVRRAFKIWPLYYLFLGFVLIHNVRHGEAWAGLTSNLLHLQNYLHTSPRGHTWSLAVEEHFYLALPLLLVWLARGTTKSSNDKSISPGEPSAQPIGNLPFIPWIALGLLVISPIVRWIASAWLPLNTLLEETHFRIDALFFGVFIAYVYHFHSRTLDAVARHRKLLWLVAAVSLTPLFFTDPGYSRFAYTGGFTLLTIGYGAILILLIHTHPGLGLMGRVLISPVGRVVAFIGTYSYAIYLWHIDLPAVRWISRRAALVDRHGRLCRTGHGKCGHPQPSRRASGATASR
jgi:peptidoglycan/LPS O-acetylase OafA/YrhL